jgi:hypothetical protein
MGKTDLKLIDLDYARTLELLANARSSEAFTKPL